MSAIRTMPLVALALLAAACDREKQETPASLASSGAPVPRASATASAAAAAVAGGARDEKASDDLSEFAFSYPAAAGAIPALKAQLDADLAAQRAELAKNARAQKAESAKEGFPFNKLGSWTEWKVVTDLPGWLSLSADISDYQGGAHPNHGFAALVWDRQAGVRRDPKDLFTSRAALSQAIRKPFCAELDRQRAAKRGGESLGGGVPEFESCIDPAESTVILGSSNRKAFDRIGVLVAPYEAGPYAEGDYEVTLPVTPAVLAAVKPQYRAAFVAK